jgi:uncharacterized membrane protein
MRNVLLVVGIIAIAVGLSWIGQGTGYVHWPASSFMISQMQWAYYGVALALVGVFIIFWSRRR